VSQFPVCLLGTLATVGGVLLLERVPVGRHATAGTRYPRLDGAFDPDKSRRTPVGSLLLGRRRLTIPLLGDVARERRTLRDATEQLILTGRVVGSVDGAAQLFDRNFRPVNDRARARLRSVLVVMRQGEPLPPIDVMEWGGSSYVVDGHHRVAAAGSSGRLHQRACHPSRLRCPRHDEAWMPCGAHVQAARRQEDPT
jgi:hypothetical protein